MAPCCRNCQCSTSQCRSPLLQGLRLVDLYSKKGIDLSRIYIKVISHPAGAPARRLSRLPAAQGVGRCTFCR